MQSNSACHSGRRLRDSNLIVKVTLRVHNASGQMNTLIKKMHLLIMSVYTCRRWKKSVQVLCLLLSAVCQLRRCRIVLCREASATDLSMSILARLHVEPDMSRQELVLRILELLFLFLVSHAVGASPTCSCVLLE